MPVQRCGEQGYNVMKCLIPPLIVDIKEGAKDNEENNNQP